MFALIEKKIINSCNQENCQEFNNFYLVYQDEQVATKNNHIVIFEGYAYRRIDFVEMLNKTDNQNYEALTVDEILELYLVYKEQFLTKIDGSYCGVIINFNNDTICEVVGFTDAVAKKTLYFYNDDGFGLTNDINLFKALTNQSSINEDFFIHQILLGSSFNKLTIVPNLFKLFGGTYIKYNCNFNPNIKRYFYIEKELKKINKIDSNIIIKNQRNLIFNTVKKYFHSKHRKIMCDVSGGIDSSTLVGILSILNKNNSSSTHIYGYHLGIPKGIGTEVGFAEDVSKMHNLDLIVEERNIEDFKLANFSQQPTIIRENLLFQNSIKKLYDFQIEKGIELAFSGQGGDITLNESHRIFKKKGIFIKRYRRNYFKEALLAHKNYWRYLDHEQEWRMQKNFYEYIKNLFLLEYPSWIKISEQEFAKKFNQIYYKLGCFNKCDKMFLDYYIDLESFSDIQLNPISRFPYLDVDLIINSIYLDLRNVKKSNTYRGYYKKIFADILPERILKRTGKSRVDVKVLERLQKNEKILSENIENFAKQFSFIDEQGLQQYFLNIINGSTNLSIFLRLIAIFKAYELKN